MRYNLVTNKLSSIIKFSVRKHQVVRSLTSKSKTEDVEVPVNPLKDFYSANQQKVNGVIYDKKPFKILCEEGKIYHWCLCGQSKRQPFCDGTHNNVFLKIKIKPIKFTVTKTKEYWLCNCKQTLNRPFCDGTHKSEEIQEMKK